MLNEIIKIRKLLEKGKVEKAIESICGLESKLLANKKTKYFIGGVDWSLCVIYGGVILTLYPESEPILLFWFSNFNSILEFAHKIKGLKGKKEYAIIENRNDRLLWKVVVGQKYLKSIADEIIVSKEQLSVF